MFKDTTVFIDTETGGLRWSHPIIQIGAVAAHEGQIVESFECKLQFDPAECDREALKANSYNEEVWEAGAIPQSKAAAKLDTFLRKHALERISARGKPYKAARLGGHNLNFDTGRLRNFFRDCGLGFFPADTARVLDTLHLASWLGVCHAEYENCRLETLCSLYGIDAGSHDALADAVASFHLAMRLVEEWNHAAASSK